jgi:hypothetical protein
MAQKANPDLNSTIVNGNDNRRDWAQKMPPGNARLGPGIGNQDRATVEKLSLVPEFEGQSRDSRFRKGTR